MASVARRSPFVRKPTEQLLETAEGSSLHRGIGALDLTALGIGAIIGTGIFVIVGEAIGESGPALVISFVLAGVTCIFSALSYAELASTIPVSGSAYTYAYATMGELLAFVIGWDLILEYGVSVAAVAVGWGAYFVELMDSLFGITLSDAISLPPGDGGKYNIPAFLLVLAVAARADRGHPAVGALEHRHGDHQAGGAGLLHRGGRFRPSTAITSRTSRPTAGAGSRTPPPSSSSPTSASTLCRRAARRARTPAATCRSRSSARS